MRNMAKLGREHELQEYNRDGKVLVRMIIVCIIRTFLKSQTLFFFFRSFIFLSLPFLFFFAIQASRVLNTPFIYESLAPVILISLSNARRLQLQVQLYMAVTSPRGVESGGKSTLKSHVSIYNASRILGDPP